MPEKLDPTALADDGNDLPGHQPVNESMFFDYVMNTGELPEESAKAFATYADENWYEYNDNSSTQTNADIISGMLAYWRGQ